MCVQLQIGSHINTISLHRSLLPTALIKTLSGAACSELFACSVGGKYVSTVHSPLSDFDPTAGAGARLHVWAEGNASKHRY